MGGPVATLLPDILRLKDQGRRIENCKAASSNQIQLLVKYSEYLGFFICTVWPSTHSMWESQPLTLCVLTADLQLLRLWSPSKGGVTRGLPSPQVGRTCLYASGVLILGALWVGAGTSRLYQSDHQREFLHWLLFLMLCSSVFSQRLAVLIDANIVTDKVASISPSASIHWAPWKDPRVLALHSLSSIFRVMASLNP